MKKLKTLTTERTKKEKHLDDLEISLALYILKNYSSIDNAFSPSEIASLMSSITGNTHSDKTIKRKLSALLSLFDDSFNDSIEAGSIFNIEECEFENIQDALISIYGGSLCATNVGKRIKYYFQPVLDISDVDMLKGIVLSNRYLSDKAKNYLNSRLSLLNPGTQIEDSAKLHSMVCDVAMLSDKPQIHFLDVVNMLHSCLEDKTQVKIVYGSYKPTDLGKLEFVPHDYSYTLNPYALLWNKGNYYLLATHDGFENIAHFRVDRIYEIEKTDNKRAKIPAGLKKYFKKENKVDVFQPIAYTTTYPLMGIYNEPNLVTCQLECTGQALAYIIDTLGTSVSVKPTADNTFLVTARNVQFDCLFLMCMQQTLWIKPLAPAELVTQVRQALQASIQTISQ